MFHVLQHPGKLGVYKIHVWSALRSRWLRRYDRHRQVISKTIVEPDLCSPQAECLSPDADGAKRRVEETHHELFWFVEVRRTGTSTVNILAGGTAAEIPISSPAARAFVPPTQN